MGGARVDPPRLRDAGHCSLCQVFLDHARGASSMRAGRNRKSKSTSPVTACAYGPLALLHVAEGVHRRVAVCASRSQGFRRPWRDTDTHKTALTLETYKSPPSSSSSSSSSLSTATETVAAHALPTQSTRKTKYDSQIDLRCTWYCSWMTRKVCMIPLPQDTTPIAHKRAST